MDSLKTSAALGILQSSRQGSPMASRGLPSSATGPASGEVSAAEGLSAAGTIAMRKSVSVPELEKLSASASNPMHNIVSSVCGLPAALPATASMSAYAPFQPSPTPFPAIGVSQAQLQPLLLAMLTADLHAPLARASSADSSVGSSSPPAAKNNALYKVCAERPIMSSFSLRLSNQRFQGKHFMESRGLGPRAIRM